MIAGRTATRVLAILCLGLTVTGCASEPPRFVFAIGGSGVAAYRIDAKTGALTALPGSPFPVGDGANGGAVVTSSGRFLYVGHRVSGAPGRITAWAIDGSGALKAAGSYPVDRDVRSLVLAPDGRFLYATQSIAGRDAVSAFRIDAATGALTAAGPPVLSLRGLAIDPTGRFAFVLRQGESASDDHHVMAYPIDQATGALAAASVAEAPLPTGQRGESLGVTRSGRLLYVLLARRQVHHGDPRSGYFSWIGDVAVFAIDPATGALAPASEPPVTVGAASYARTFTLAPSGRFLFVADEETPPIDLGSVWGYEIAPATGGLTPMSGSPVHGAMRTTAVTIDRDDRFLYTTSVGPAPKQPGTIWSYAIDPQLGTLQPVPGAPYATAPLPTAVVTITRVP